MGLLRINVEHFFLRIIYPTTVNCIRLILRDCQRIYFYQHDVFSYQPQIDCKRSKSNELWCRFIEKKIKNCFLQWSLCQNWTNSSDRLVKRALINNTVLIIYFCTKRRNKKLKKEIHNMKIINDKKVVRIEDNFPSHTISLNVSLRSDVTSFFIKAQKFLQFSVTLPPRLTQFA